MQLVNDLYVGAQDYWAEIPTDTAKAAIYSTVGGFVINVLVVGNAEHALHCGLAAGTASIIYGLITPLFKLVIGNPLLTRNEEMCRKVLPLVAVRLFAGSLGFTKNNLGAIDDLLYLTALLLFLQTDKQNKIDQGFSYAWVA